MAAPERICVRSRSASGSTTWEWRPMPADNASLWAIPVAAAAVVLVSRRLVAYLRYFQQEGYEHLRFLRWTGVRPLTDPAFWIAVAAAWLSSRSAAWSAVWYVAGAVVLIGGQPDPRRSGKITLKLTWRATRVLVVSGVVAAGFWLAWNALDGSGLRAVYTASALVAVLLPL